MNTFDIKTKEKVMVPLRIPADLYQGITMIIREEKDNGNRGYSMNQYLSELLEKDIAARLNGKIKY